LLVLTKVLRPEGLSYNCLPAARLARLLESAEAGEDHFTEGRGVFAQHRGSELRALCGVACEVGAIDVVEQARALRRRSGVFGPREDFAEGSRFLLRLLNAIP
jgi:hypothetical protein